MFTAGLAESEMEVVTLQGVEPDMIRSDRRKEHWPAIIERVQRSHGTD